MAATGFDRMPGQGFSSRTARFQSLGLHPELLTGSQHQSTPNVAPGSYDLMQYGDFSEQTIQKRMEGPNWQQALYTEQLAKFPHPNFRETYEKRLEDQKRLGPGTYPINDFITEADRRPRCARGALDQLSPRFPKEQLDKAPPPGAYGIPDEKIHRKRWEQGSNIPSLDWNQGPRTLPLQGSKIGPGTYNIKNSIDELINKRVSEKGPYQIFSLDRSAPIATGHYAVLDTWDLSPDFPSKDYPESTSITHELTKSKHGTFSKLNRFQKKPTNRLAIEHPGLEPKNVDFPGPGAYVVTRPWEKHDYHAKKVGFNSSSTRNDNRSFTSTGGHNTVGVGRYNIVSPVRDETIADKRKRPKRRNIAFSSTTSRFATVDGESLLNERLKPHNLRLEQRQQLFLKGHI
ncbi:unnamed protein product [Rotaria socialis]|uniref:Uncharacterized protein n=1 Tax=Rotaria socialis TaxID=392032 RepID=A0A818KH81_9BILA|nr:unnamed protein product [Rotaria socialis]CAF3272939.1 unnamed protein product [Rotaria socialis]CAF3416007.1 unnamed protein product [Rotaria socialis]CAF3558220.1 unnamed protein product [Rotaria socialis]CAF3608468.1 unnamed protein product [Rotaria socialis]